MLFTFLILFFCLEVLFFFGLEEFGSLEDKDKFDVKVLNLWCIGVFGVYVF